MTDISVILCAYNEVPNIKDAIRSLDAQTLAAERFELVVVDDGSADNTMDVVENAVGDARYETTLLQNKTNRGLAASANRGINHANGRYVVRLDGDDSFAPSTLQRLLDSARSSGSSLVYSDRYELNADIGQVRYIEANHTNLYSLVAAGALMGRDILTRIGGYRDFFWEEYDLYIRYLEASDTTPTRISRPLMVYLRHDESMTADDERVHDGWAKLVAEWGKERLSQYGTLPSYISDNES